jgi:glucosylceramidase
MKIKFKYAYLLLGLSFLITACGTSACDSKEQDIDPEPVPETTDKEVYVLVTTNNRASDLMRSDVDFSTTSNMSPNTITLQPDTQFQEMDGFGAAVTGSSCYNLLQMSQEDRTKFLTETFSHEKGYGFSYVRMAIGCSDFSLSEYTCCDTPGLENFALQTEELD